MNENHQKQIPANRDTQTFQMLELTQNIEISMFNIFKDIK